MNNNLNNNYYKMFDCGCIVSRPINSKFYACRWKIYRSLNYIVLRCKDCGKMYHFELKYYDERVLLRNRSEINYEEDVI